MILDHHVLTTMLQPFSFKDLEILTYLVSLDHPGVIYLIVTYSIRVHRGCIESCILPDNVSQMEEEEAILEVSLREQYHLHITGVIIQKPGMVDESYRQPEVQMIMSQMENILKA